MMKVFLTILLISFTSSRGCWGCKTEDIKIISGKSGRMVQGKPEYTVYVYNKCKCPVEAIMCSCPNFQTVEPVDPINMIPNHGDRCIINGNRPLPVNGYVKFAYAWDHPYSFAPLQMKAVGC